MNDIELQNLKVPPHSTQAEQAILGALLQDNHLFDHVADLLSAHDFYRMEHRLIFETIARLIMAFKPADILTVAEAVDKNIDFGGITYLNELTQNTPNMLNIKPYADIVRERAILREMISTCHDLSERAFMQKQDAKELLDEAERRILEINESRQRARSGFVDTPKVLMELLQQLNQQRNQRALNPSDQNGNLTGVCTGFTDLDRITSGFQRGDLVIIAARPSMGKTALAVNIAEHVGLEQGLPVAIFSMEMSASQLFLRMMASQAMVHQQNLRSGNLNAENWAGITQAFKTLTESQIHVDETPGLTPMELRSRARRLSRQKNGLGLIVVDYLQLMQTARNNSYENRANEISEISRSLKSLAREMNCPVVALSQLNRGVEQRVDKMPLLSDLRESGAIEQDADVILFIYRDEFYNKESQHKGKAEIKIGKQRNGEAGGSVFLTFQGQFSRFDNTMPKHQEQDYYA